jgi:hypothetical protein
VLLDTCVCVVEAGEEAVLPYETTAHGITGHLKFNSKGKAIGMGNDPTGVGFREYALLRARHKVPCTKQPRCIRSRPHLSLSPTHLVCCVMKRIK